MPVLRFGTVRARRPGLSSLPSMVMVALLGSAFLWGQVLTKEYINLNGRTLAIETPVPTFTMLNIAPGGSYPIHTTQQTISFQVNSPTGIDHIEFVLDNLWNSTDACDVTYLPANNELDFDDPMGNTTAYTFGPGATQPTATNYACILDLVHTSITATTSGATVNLPITLQKSSVGIQNVYVTVVDKNFNFFYGGIPRASWLAYDEITTAPTYSLLNTLTTSNSQTLQFKFSDVNGFRYIDQYAQVMLAAASDAAGNNSPCYLSLTPAQQFATLSSYSNGVGTTIGSGALGQAGSITGSHCSVPDLLHSKVHINPNPTLPDPDPNGSVVVTDMYLDLVLSLDTTVAHPEGVFAGDIDRAGRGVFASPPSGSTAFQVGTWP